VSLEINSTVLANSFSNTTSPCSLDPFQQIKVPPELPTDGMNEKWSKVGNLGCQIPSSFSYLSSLNMLTVLPMKLWPSCWDISWLALTFGCLLHQWKAMGRTSKFTWTCVLPSRGNCSVHG
jgi:hypothetical protein